MASWANIKSLFGLLSEEELVKKDDDHRVVKNGSLTANWQPPRGPQRRTLKRAGLLLIIALAIYMFVKNIPTDLGPRDHSRPNYSASQTGAHSAHRSGSGPAPGHAAQPQSKPKEPGAPPSVAEQTYDGPIKFMELAVSLNAISGTKGGLSVNRNVLFAASSLKSASTLLPMACQMGMELKNYVHFALLSRSEIKLEELQAINGVDKSCNILFHDARPDFSATSTQPRLETAIFRAFYHLHQYIHPQAIIVDGSSDEDSYFLNSGRLQVQAVGDTMIQLPENSAKSLSWITKLESTSLKAWDKDQIDILIQARPGTSGSLIRLLTSMSKADYTSNSIPHLTIELPQDIDSPTKQFLETFAWPPERGENPSHLRYLSIRHRIPQKSLTEEESSIRFLESFWPRDPLKSHVLVLSPQVELSPNYFQYLKYALLQYRHSTDTRMRQWTGRILGISLEQPARLLDGETPLVSPLYHNSSDTENSEGRPTPFLWQAPTSNAMLFLGDKWMELHDLVSRTLRAEDSSSTTADLLAEKSVSKHSPSWLEHVLRLSRVRGYWTLFPGEAIARNLATVHTELSHLPEEYADLETSAPRLPDKATDREIDKFRERLKAAQYELALSRDSLANTLTESGSLIALGDLPILSWDGQKTEAVELDSASFLYATEFKRSVGRCGSDGSKKKKKVEYSAEDLFCDAV